MDHLPLAFQPLVAVKQFIIYKVQPSPKREGKLEKFPIDYRTGFFINAMDKAVWTDVDTALTAANQFGEGYGVGFVLTENDPYFFLDIDNCLLQDNSGWSTLACDLLNRFKGAAFEVSSSGRGLHILGKGNASPHNCRNEELNLEFYTANRFIALTGTHAGGSIDFDCTEQLSWLVPTYFDRSKGLQLESDWWSDTPCSEWNGPLDDNELLRRARQSTSGKTTFGLGATFDDLWTGNTDILALVYPSGGKTSYNASSADAALAQHLAFWTGNNAERMLRLMQQSALVRDKWERPDYLPRTIRAACSKQTEWLCDKKPIIPIETKPIEHVPNILNAPIPITGSRILDATQQIELFKGCVYVCDEHRALVPGGMMLDPQRFRVMYGGYQFVTDSLNGKMTRNAWDAFTESQAISAPRAESAFFKPTLAPGAIVYEDNRRLVNLWWPIDTPKKEGNIDPFLHHLKTLLPDERDQKILLSYMAAVIQYPGVKFSWAPLLQGVEGNGKTLFTMCLAYGVGFRYSHFPKAAEIASKFNDWLYCRLFIGIEDIFVSVNKQEIYEALKPMITGVRQEIEPKNGTKITREVCANFLLNTNHKDGLKKTLNDRRFAPFYTAQQTKDDLRRDGLTGLYFSKLYRWLEAEGYPIVNHFLTHYKIDPELNPAELCRVAPETSATQEAIAYSLGSIEQEIIEAIEQGIPGFKGGWASSMAVDRLLEKMRAAKYVPQNKRRDLMRNIGYDLHPHLDKGRVNNIVAPDNGKPRLYLTPDHPARTLTKAAEIAKAYSDAQLTA
jgi:hypothetical protein